MSAERIPLAYRDKCASVLAPLNRCRKNEWYLPWKCEVRVCSPRGEMGIEGNVHADVRALIGCDGWGGRMRDTRMRSASMTSL